MPAKAMTMDELPVVARGVGKVATEPIVAFRESGQIAFNSVLTKALNGAYAVMIYRDGAKGLIFAPVDKDKFTEAQSKKLAAFELKYSKKGSSQCYFAGASVLRAFQYDYRKAKNQNFSVKMGKNNIVLVTLPDDTPIAKPVVRRTKKAKTNGANGGVQIATTATTVAATPQVPPPSVDASDLGVDL